MEKIGIIVLMMVVIGCNNPSNIGIQSKQDSVPQIEHPVKDSTICYAVVDGVKEFDNIVSYVLVKGKQRDTISYVSVLKNSKLYYPEIIENGVVEIFLRENYILVKPTSETDYEAVLEIGC